MDWLLSSGWLVNGIIALTLMELALLFGFHRVTGRGLAPDAYLLNLLSGLALMLALRLAIGHADWWWPTLCLASAGVAHWGDIWRRLRRADRSAGTARQ